MCVGYNCCGFGFSLFLEKGECNSSFLLACRVARVLRSRIEDVFIFGDCELFPLVIGKVWAKARRELLKP